MQPLCKTWHGGTDEQFNLCAGAYISVSRVAASRALYNPPEAICCVGGRIAGLARTRRCVASGEARFCAATSNAGPGIRAPDYQRPTIDRKSAVVAKPDHADT